MPGHEKGLLINYSCSLAGFGQPARTFRLPIQLFPGNNHYVGISVTLGHIDAIRSDWIHTDSCVRDCAFVFLLPSWGHLRRTPRRYPVVFYGCACYR